MGGLPPPTGVDRGHMAIEMRLHGKDAMAIDEDPVSRGQTLAAHFQLDG